MPFAFLQEYLSFWDEAERFYSYFFLPKIRLRTLSTCFSKNSLVEYLLDFFNNFFLFLG